jgi:hypothetical protein
MIIRMVGAPRAALAAFTSAPGWIAYMATGSGSCATHPRHFRPTWTDFLDSAIRFGGAPATRRLEAGMAH